MFQRVWFMGNTSESGSRRRSRVPEKNMARAGAGRQIELVWKSLGEGGCGHWLKSPCMVTTPLQRVAIDPSLFGDEDDPLKCSRDLNCCSNQ